MVCHVCHVCVCIVSIGMAAADSNNAGPLAKTAERTIFSFAFLCVCFCYVCLSRRWILGFVVGESFHGRMNRFHVSDACEPYSRSFSPITSLPVTTIDARVMRDGPVDGVAIDYVVVPNGCIERKVGYTTLRFFL